MSSAELLPNMHMLTRIKGLPHSQLFCRLQCKSQSLGDHVLLLTSIRVSLFSAALVGEFLNASEKEKKRKVVVEFTCLQSTYDELVLVMLGNRGVFCGTKV